MSKFYTGLFKSDKFRDRVIDARDTYNSTHIESGFMAAKRLMEGTLTSYDKPYIIYDVLL